MKITWFGTASLLIDSGAEQLLIDPFLCLPGAENHPALTDYLKTDNILITHGHFDHLATVRKIMALSDATVYCTRRPARTLEKKRADSDYISVIQPGTKLSFKDISVEVLPGAHAHFDKKIIRQTIFNIRMLRYLFNLPRLLYGMLAYPEGHETISYLIRANNKQILVLGSMGLDDQTEYPMYADLLILPYQGTSTLAEDAVHIIERLSPQAVMLSHFDDSYPPITQSVDTKELKKVLSERFPKLRVVKPSAGKTITIL